MRYSLRPLKHEVRLNNILKLGSYVTDNILRLPHVQSGMQVDAKHTSLRIVFNFFFKYKSGSANTGTVRKCDFYPPGRSNVTRIYA